jgi:hypothetical protein
MIFALSTSFASEDADDMQASDELGIEPIAINDESMDDSPIDEESLSAGVPDGVESDKISSIDESENKLSEEEGTFTELNETINSNNDGFVDLDKDYYGTDFSYDGIVINKAVTIDGHGHVLNARNFGTIFQVTTTSKIVFKNLTFKGATFSAIIFNKEAHVDFQDCSFINNQKESTQTNGLRNGGAIHFKSNLVDSSFNNVSFINNTIFSWEGYSSVWGGAICVEGYARNNNFTNVFFYNNRALDKYNVHTGGIVYYHVGGAIAFKGEASNNRFTNSTFISNYNSGSLYTPSSSSYYYSSPYYGMYQGGAIYFSSNVANAVFDGCLFENNRAAAGGGMFFNGQGTNISVVNSKFIGNDVEVDWYSTEGSTNDQYEGKGAAICMRSAVNLVVDNSLFDDNSATKGGAIYIRSNDNFLINNSNFTENNVYAWQVNNNYQPFTNPSGGAVYLRSSASLKIENSKFEGNYIYVTSYDERFTNLNGGAVYISTGSNTTINNTLFADNHAKSYGGAFYGGSMYDCLFIDVNFTNNRLDSIDYALGGAAFISSGNNINFTNVNFDSNSIVDKFSNTVKSGYYAYGSAARLGGNNVNLYNVNFTNNLLKIDSKTANKVYLGTVYLYGSNITFDHVNIIDNKIEGPYVNLVGGGAIATSGDTLVNNLTINNTLIINNTSPDKGAIYIKGGSGFAIDNTIFEGNNGTEGAAIYANNVNGITITNSEFKNNNATKSASAIYISGKFAKIENVNCTSNNLITKEATANGGVLYLSLTNSYLDRINLIGNKDDRTSADAAAIYAYKSTSVSFNNMNVIDNSAYKIGVFVLRTAKDVNISNSVFKGNSIASTYGSAPNTPTVINTDSSISIRDCEFEDNDVYQADVYYYYYSYNNYNNVYLNISGSTFKKSKAAYGVYAYAVPVNITGCDFTGYTGSDVVYLYNSRNAIIKDSNFTNNTCSYGAIQLSSASGYPATIDNVNFINNSANNDGGAIYFSSSSGARVTNSYFKDNSAYGNGGTIYVSYSSRVHINAVNITGSTSGSNGGAIYVTSSAYVFNITDSTIENCAAADCGGAIYLYNAFDYNGITNVAFSNNTALYGGALYVNQYARINIDESTFTNNSAMEYGGAVYVSSDATVGIDNSEFTRNTAAYGSAINNYGTLTVSNSSFFKNKANSTGLEIIFNRESDETNVFYTVADNYINAINSPDDGITFTNVEYFEYEGSTIFNTDVTPAVNNYSKANQTFAIEFSDENNTVLASYIMNSDMDGRLYIGADRVPQGRHHVTVKRFEDDYYTSIESSVLCIWGDFTILQRLINALDDNGVLELNRTYIYTIGADNMTEGIVINKTNITINANGYTINALFKSRIFQVLTSDVKFHNIHFANASGLEGAFIFGIDVNNTEIINCSFMNTFDFDINDYPVRPVFPAPSGGGSIPDPIIDPGRGGTRGPISGGYDPYMEMDEMYVGSAVYITGNNLDVINSNFTNIVANFGASVFFEGENATFINSRFNNTKAGYGGAIYAYANDVVIDSCCFYNNTAQFAGGAIFAFGENHSISDSNFTNCHIIDDDISGISDIDDYVYFSYSRYDEPDSDPVIPVEPDPGSGKDITRSAESGNLGEGDLIDPGIMPAGSADDEVIIGPSIPDLDYMGGGAIYSEAVNVSIKGSIFDNCSADSLGGAILANGNNTNITDSTFNSCYATSGGAVAICLWASNSTIDGCSFEGNGVMRNGGAISWYGENGTLRDSVFNGNFQHGLDYDSYRNNPNAENPLNGGGAVFWGGIYASIDNCNFTGSSVCIPAGNYVDALVQEAMEWGLSREEAMMQVYSSLGNDYSYGGAILVRGTYINITNSNFKNNFAQSGGAIAIINPNSEALTIGNVPSGVNLEEVVMSNINIDACKFDSNFAQYAGAVLISGYRNNIYNSEFTNNTALIAGALNLQGVESMVHNVTFKDNNAFIAGALLSGFATLQWVDDGYGYWYERSVVAGYDNTVDNVSFINNGAEGAGAVYWLDDNGVINNAKFIENRIINSYDVYSKCFNDCYGLEIDEEMYNDLKRRFSYNLIPDFESTIDFAGAVFWTGYNGLLNDSEFIKNNATFAGAVSWKGDDGVVNNSEFVENSAVYGSAIVWMGEYGTVDNSILRDNKGFTVAGQQAESNRYVATYFLSEERSEYYYGSTYDYDRIAREKYEQLLPTIQSIYGEDVSLIYTYYTKKYIRSSSYYRYYNMTYGLVLLVSESSSYSEPMDKSMGTIFWAADDGLVNNTDLISNIADYGAGIYVRGYGVLVNNSNFINNSANKGGAIYWDGDYGTVENSVFKDNYGYENSDVLTWDGYKYITYHNSFNYAGSYVGNNIELYSGLEDSLNDILQTYGCDYVTVRDVTFTYVQKEDGSYDVDVDYSLMFTERNECSYTVQSLGGAIYWNADDALILDSEFINNSANKGAAVYIEGYYGNVVDSTFKDNQAKDYNEPSMLDMSWYVGYDIFIEDEGYAYSSTFDYAVEHNLDAVIDNVSKLYDYDVLIYDGYSYEIFDIQDPETEYGPSKFKVKLTYVFSLINYTMEYHPSASAGAAIYLNGEEAFVDGSSFIANNASSGGAVYVNGENCLVNNSIFENNTVYNSIIYETVKDISIVNDYIEYQRDLDYDVGEKFAYSEVYKYILGLYDDYSNADEIKVNFTIDGSRYSGDWNGYYLSSIDYTVQIINYGNRTTIGSYGGAIYTNAANTLINASTFNKNTAEHGGAIHINGEYNMINASEFNSNEAEFGGAAYVNATALINSTTFNMNHGYLAGAVYWDGENGIVNASRFFNNSARNAGAIYYGGNNNTIGGNSIFMYNKADTGSALYVYGTGLKVRSSTFLENQAKSSSINYYNSVSDDNTLVVHIIFSGNDNFINAMYIVNECVIEDVTYCPVASSEVPRITNLEDGIRVLVKLSDSNSNLTRTANLTNINGEAVIVIPNLKYGRYLFTVEHEEDNYYTEITKTDIIYLGPATTPIELIAPDIFYKENATVDVRVPIGVSGKFDVYVDGKYFTSINISKYEGSFVIPNLKGGIHNVTVNYLGNEIYYPNSTSTMFTVKPIPTTLVVTSEGGIYREDIPVNVVLGDADATGKVILTIDTVHGITLAIKDSNELSGIINSLDVGTYNITAFYIGDNNYLNATNKTTFKVAPTHINAQAVSYNIPSNENPKFIVSIPTDFVGKVKITVDGISRVFDVSGSTTFTFDRLSAGDKSANLSFYGNKNYIDEYLISNFTVYKTNFTEVLFTIHADDMTRGANSPYDYQAEFVGRDGEVLSNAEVAFVINGIIYKARTNGDGIAQLTTSNLPVGTYDVKIINLATGDETTRRLTIVARLLEDTDLVMDFRDGTSFVVKVIGDDGNIAPEGEIVSITANGVSYVAKVGKDGYARLLIKLNPDTYSIIMEYKGFKTYKTLVVKQTLKLTKKTIKIKKKAKKLILKAKLKASSGKPLKGKLIKFKFRGKTYKVKTNKKGVAKVKIKKKVIIRLKKGNKYRYSATYFTNCVKGWVKIKK